MFEGVPNYPSMSRFWEVIDKHKVNIFYTAPTAIRALMQAGDDAGEENLARLAAAPRLGRRADQSGSLGMVSPRRRRRPLPDRRYLVADRDRRHFDHAAAGRHATQARFGDAAVLRRRAADRRCRGQSAGGRDQRQSVHRRFLARPDAHRLWRSPALRRNLFQHLSGQVFHRRRLPPRRGRLLLDHRPRRRRDQRRRPSPGHRRSRSRRWSRIRKCRRPRSSAIRTTSRGRASTPMSP